VIETDLEGHNAIMLGQADLETTEIYTLVAILAVAEIHRAPHPAKLERDKRELEEKLEAEEGEDV
jgi:integrase/recombinase XerD